MKPGVRALGVAESFRGTRGHSTLAGAVVRADRTVDDLAFAACTIGGTDATDAVVACWDRLDRPDVRYLLLSGIAPAWYNVLDLHEIRDRVERPVVSVTFEESGGLEAALREAFDGEALSTRLETYRGQPGRDPLAVNGETVFVRAVGLAESEARDVVRAFTPEGGRPEPLRVARTAARAGRAYRERATGDGDAPEP